MKWHWTEKVMAQRDSDEGNGREDGSDDDGQSRSMRR